MPATFGCQVVGFCVVLPLNCHCMENKKLKSHLAILTVNIIFGVGIPVTKYLLDNWVDPMTYMTMRCVGAALMFWTVSLFLPKEKVKPRDLAVIILGGLMGFIVSQTLTAWALNYTSPVYYSLIATLTPVAVMLMAALFLREGITAKKTWGVILGVAGAVLMVVFKWHAEAGSNDFIGIMLTILSLLTWAGYLIITRKVSEKYTPVTQMKWIFLVSAVAVLPFSWNGIVECNLFNGSRSDGLWLGISAMAFIVVFATVLGYFFIPFAMKHLKTTTVSIYTNMQPVVASFVAIGLGQDLLTWDKIVAAVLILLSAYIVTRE